MLKSSVENRPSSQATIRSAASSADMVVVSTTISGVSGAS